MHDLVVMSPGDVRDKFVDDVGSMMVANAKAADKTKTNEKKVTEKAKDQPVEEVTAAL